MKKNTFLGKDELQTFINPLKVSISEERLPVLRLQDFRVRCEEQQGPRLLLDLALNGSEGHCVLFGVSLVVVFNRG